MFYDFRVSKLAPMRVNIQMNLVKLELNWLLSGVWGSNEINMKTLKKFYVIPHKVNNYKNSLSLNDKKIVS